MGLGGVRVGDCEGVGCGVKCLDQPRLSCQQAIPNIVFTATSQALTEGKILTLGRVPLSIFASCIQHFYAPRGTRYTVFLRVVNGWLGCLSRSYAGMSRKQRKHKNLVIQDTEIVKKFYQYTCLQMKPK